LLGAGAKSVERVAQATGVDRAIDQAVEEAIVRALASPSVRRALTRALAATEREDEEVARITRRVLESEATEQLWAELLASAQVQMLVERIANAPEVRAAITSQGAGLITDIGIRLTRITERVDDLLERVVRQNDEETDQAGLATRTAAAAVDFGLLALVYSLASSVLASVIPFTFGGRLSLGVAIGLVVSGLLVAGGIIVTFWALVGQTPGMRFLSIRLVHTDAENRDITARCATRRMFAALLSLLPAGLGFLAILRSPQRHAWHDRMTGTEIIYDRDSRRAPYSLIVRDLDRDQESPQS
jgi:uncharacterized RDD family membrane protein YckC